MVKPPRVRHSKTQREPVTIDLEPGAVSRVPEGGEPIDDAGEPLEAAATVEADAPPADAAAEASAAQAPAEDANLEARAEMAETASTKPAEAGPAKPSFGRDAERSTTYAKPTETPRATAEARPRVRASALFMGIVGGIVALAIAWGLQQAGVIPLGGEPAPGNDAAVTALEAEIATLKTDVAALKTAPAPEGTDELQAAIDASTTRVDEFGAALDTVRTDLADLRKAVEAGGAGDGAAVQALATRIGEIEAAVASLGQAGASDPAALEALGKRIDTMEAAISAAAAATAATDGRIAALEQSLASLSGQLEALGGQPKIALAIAAAALRAALDRGGTFVAEVETFAAVAPDSPDIAALREVAARGVATRAQIASEMSETANTMIAAGNATSEDVGFFEGIWDGIGSLVTVRPIGEVAGPGVPETVARMEVAVQRGDLVKALAEYDSLSEPAKTAGAAFAETIRTRLAAEQLIEKALAAALQAT